MKSFILLEKKVKNFVERDIGMCNSNSSFGVQVVWNIKMGRFN